MTFNSYKMKKFILIQEYYIGGLHLLKQLAFSMI